MNDEREIRRERRGFTILELLIVVSMIGILAAMSMSRSSRIMTGWRVNRAAQAMSEELQQAFAIVGRNRKPMIISFDTANMIMYIRDRGDTVYRQRAFGVNTEYKIRGMDMDLTTLRLEVYPPGLAADSLSIVIARTGTQRRIRMLRGGLVQICPHGIKTRC